MLSKEALKAAMPLTEVLDGAGIYLTAIDQTPLSALVKATRSDDRFSGVHPSGETGYHIEVETIEYMANKKDDVLGVCAHDVAMDEIIEVATKAVQGHMLFAKTVVAPTVQALAERVMEALNAVTPSSLTGMEVVVRQVAKPLENPSLEASVRRFEEIASDSPALVLNLPDRTVAELTELMLTGTAGLDRDIKEWLAVKGESFLIDLWQGVFQQKPAELNEREVRVFADYVSHRLNGPDNALAIYLLARTLVEEPLEGTQMPLAVYENAIVQIRDQAGLRVVYALNDIDRNKKSGILVLDQTERTVTVNGSVYREWIEQGGENEVLFGNMLEQPSVITIHAIDEKKAHFLSQWNRHLALVATVESNRRFNRTKELLEKVFSAQLLEVTEGEEAVTANRETVLAMFREQLEVVREDELADLYSLCLRLVCRSRFHRTDAERILSGIERIKRENPRIDVREAAAMSLIEYVAYWLTAQFKPVVQ